MNRLIRLQIFTLTCLIAGLSVAGCRVDILADSCDLANADLFDFPPDVHPCTPPEPMEVRPADMSFNVPRNFNPFIIFNVPISALSLENGVIFEEINGANNRVFDFKVLDGGDLLQLIPTANAMDPNHEHQIRITRDLRSEFGVSPLEEVVITFTTGDFTTEDPGAVIPVITEPRTRGDQAYVVSPTVRVEGFVASVTVMDLGTFDVFVSVNGGAMAQANTNNGFLNWSFDAALQPGANTVTAEARRGGEVTGTDEIVIFLETLPAEARPQVNYSNIQSGGPAGAGNPMTVVPRTDAYPEVLLSEFTIEGDEQPVALIYFGINQYEITNEEFELNFFDPTGQGMFENGCYQIPALPGPSTLTCQQAWDEALAGTGRTFDAFTGFGINFNAATPPQLDVQGNIPVEEISGPGFSFFGDSRSTFWNDAPPWAFTGGYDFVSGDPNTPLIYISWYEARAYCKYVYGSQADLPSQYQWERAARGTTARVRPYPWGNALPNCQLANHNCRDTGTNEALRTMPVGSYPDGRTVWIEGLEVFDLAGNVEEWTLTWLNSGEPFRGSGWNGGLDPANVERINESNRAVMGGGWDSSSSNFLESDRRRGAAPGFRGQNLGFRCVVNP